MKPCPSRYNGAILKKLVIFLNMVELFRLNWDTARKKYVLAVWEALLKPGGSCGVRKRAVRFGELAVAS